MYTLRFSHITAVICLIVTHRKYCFFLSCSSHLLTIKWWIGCVLQHYVLTTIKAKIKWQYVEILSSPKRKIRNSVAIQDHFRTDRFNWNDGHISAAHWSTGERKNIHDLPDIPIPEDQFEKIKQKHITAKNVKNK